MNVSLQAKRQANLHEAVFSETPPFPMNLLLGLNSGCNHRCLMCPHRETLHHKKDLEPELAKRILSEAFELGSRSVGLSTLGEPFLLRHLSEIIAFAKKVGYEYIYLSTNGSLATPEKLEQALSAGLSSIKFSINGYGKEHYQVIHGRDDYEKVILHLRAAIALKQKYQFKLFISVVQTRLYPDDLKMIQAEFGLLVDEIVGYGCSNFNGYIDNSILNSAPESFPIPCPQPFNRFHISSEGYLVPCCGDWFNELAMADLRDISVQAAWNHPLLKILRKRHLDKAVAGTRCDACIKSEFRQCTPFNETLADAVNPDYWNKKSLERIIHERL
ncbi:MAG: hypothetical protein A2293_07210 [Elusimicrobia bacterium RIFOXYB2_FULL_49_7]|nr:MAG: hypothetical protein A2293_07210 [Elusimicrobia bacterium RIFOXYB2_FULL_49_7]